MIGFVGMTHLGLVSGISAASKGFKILGFDFDSQKIQCLSKSQLPIVEPQLDDLLAQSKNNIQFSSNIADLKSCELVYISVDIKTNQNNESDLTEIKNLIQKIRAHLSPETYLVVLSQVPPGFTRQLDYPSGQLFYQVETLIFGQAVERALHPERTMVGCAEPQKELPSVYQDFLSAHHCPILKMRYESAELSKISINCYLAASVSVTNTLAEICESVGAQWDEIAPSLRLDKRIGPHAYLSPGLGISGGNIERDLITVRALGHEMGSYSLVTDSFVRYSQYRKDWVFRHLQAQVLSKKLNPKLSMLGLAYKPGTHSIKNSPSLELLNIIKDFDLKVYDPVVRLSELGSAVAPAWAQEEDPYKAVGDADVVLLMTPWPEIRQLDFQKIQSLTKPDCVFIDPFSMLKRESLALQSKCFQLGFPLPEGGLV